MLDSSYLKQQTEEFGKWFRENAALKNRQIRLLRDSIQAMRYSGGWERYTATAKAPSVDTGSQLRFFGNPFTGISAPQAVRPVTLVAAAGSYIVPEPQVAPDSYLLHCSWISRHYGNLERPDGGEIDSLRFPGIDQQSFPALNLVITESWINAVCQLHTLRILLDRSREVRIKERRTVAISGSLGNLTATGTTERTEFLDEIGSRIVSCLDAFRSAAIDWVAFDAHPEASPVLEWMKNNEVPGVPSDQLSSVSDVDLFNHVLQRGERSIAFVPQNGEAENRALVPGLAFFYFKVQNGQKRDQIVRVDFPQWMNQSETRISQLHADILDQSTKANGYPAILADCEQRAVLSDDDKNVFYKLLQREIRKQSDVPFQLTKGR